MKLDYYAIVDLDSGTFFGASNAVLLDTRVLSEDELDDLNNGTDSDRSNIAEQYGIAIEELVENA